MNPRGTRVDAQLVFGISVLVSLLIAWPGLRGAMEGSADIMGVGVRFLVSVAVVWSALFAVATLIAGYASTAPAAPPRDAAPTAGFPGPGAASTGPLSAPAALELDAAQADAAARIAAETESAAG